MDWRPLLFKSRPCHASREDFGEKDRRNALRRSNPDLAHTATLPPAPPAPQAPTGPSPQHPAGPSPPSTDWLPVGLCRHFVLLRDALVQRCPRARQGRAVCCRCAPRAVRAAGRGVGGGGTCLRNSHLLDHSPPPPPRDSRAQQGPWRRPFLSKLQLFSYRHCFATKMISECQSIFSTGTPTTKNPEPIFDFETLALVDGSARGHSDSISV